MHMVSIIGFALCMFFLLSFAARTSFQASNPNTGHLSNGLRMVNNGSNAAVIRANGLANNSNMVIGG